MAETVFAGIKIIKDHWIRIFTTFLYVKHFHGIRVLQLCIQLQNGIQLILKKSPMDSFESEAFVVCFRASSILTESSCRGASYWKFALQAHYIGTGDLCQYHDVLSPYRSSAIKNWSHVGCDWIVGTCDLDVGR